MTPQEAAEYWKQKGDYPEAGAEIPAEQRLTSALNSLAGGYGAGQMAAGVVAKAPAMLADESGSLFPSASNKLKDWFGGSKVVDTAGQPKVVYHGTTKDFDTFDPSKAGAWKDDSAGFFFSESPETAGRFSVDKIDPAGANVKPVHLAIQNPKDVSAQDWTQMMGLRNPESYDPNAFVNLRAEAEKAGHDGFRITGGEGDKNVFWDLRSPTWVAFKPEQIKSAIGNSGAFDATNPNINMAFGGEVPTMKYTDQEHKPEEKSRPVIKDSTLGTETTGLQGLANRIAAKRQPVQHFADGGMAQPNPFMQALQAAGTTLGVTPGMMDAAQNAAPGVANALAPAVNAVGATTGLNLPQMSAPQPPAPSGDQGFMTALSDGTTGIQEPSAPRAPSTTPPISQVSTALNQTPPTDYSFYQPGMTADDRLALQQKLMAAQNSPGQMVAQGAAGLGDAISNSFGGKNTTFQKDVMANNEMQQKKQLDAVDTARGQKMQDMQANIEMQKNDPKSPISVGFRNAVAQLTGQKLPSGMPASIGLQILGPAGELAMKQATLAMQERQVTATIENQDASRRIEASGKLQSRSLIRKAGEAVLGDSDETKLLRQEVNEGNSAVHGQGKAPTSFPVGRPIQHPSGAIITRTN